MTLAQRLSELITRIGTEFKAIRTVTGALSALTTTDKSSLVAAINEAKASGGATINDAAASATTAYSSSKVDAQIAASKASILGGASAAFDTLAELAAAAESDATGIANLTAAVGNRIRYDAAQTLSAAQKTQACTNAGAVETAAIGNPDADLVALFNAALA